MRFIQKSATYPPLLVAWIAANRGMPNFDYASFPGEVKEELKAKLLGEQGFICAYTGLRIFDEKSHIEHLIPQKTCFAESRPELTVDYANMVACFPGSGDSEPCFGARYKDAWPSSVERPYFLSPTDSTCPGRFVYKRDGGVSAANPTDTAASETIDHLNLRHPSLISRRREALFALFQLPNGRPLTKTMLRKRLESVKAMKDGRLEEFCFAKEQVLRQKIEKWA